MPVVLQLYRLDKIKIISIHPVIYRVSFVILRVFMFAINADRLIIEDESFSFIFDKKQRSHPAPSMQEETALRRSRIHSTCLFIHSTSDK